MEYKYVKNARIIHDMMDEIFKTVESLRNSDLQKDEKPYYFKAYNFLMECADKLAHCSSADVLEDDFVDIITTIIDLYVSTPEDIAPAVYNRVKRLYRELTSIHST